MRHFVPFFLTATLFFMTETRANTLFLGRGVQQVSCYKNASPTNISVKFLPSLRELQISFDNEKPTHIATITVMNMIGRTVYSEKIEVVNGENTLRIDLSRLQAGTYVVSVNGNGWASQARKFSVATQP